MRSSQLIEFSCLGLLANKVKITVQLIYTYVSEIVHILSENGHISGVLIAFWSMQWETQPGICGQQLCDFPYSSINQQKNSAHKFRL